jgi:hypothetical protein
MHSDLFSSDLLIWNNGSYRQLVKLLGRVISPVSRPLPTQDRNAEETQTGIHVSGGIRTHDPIVRAGEDIHALDCTATVIGIW